MIVRLKVLVATIWLLFATIPSSNGQQIQQLNNHRPTITNSSSPYWRRPGCYRVGHTRTISIPGCVKFNLSTNACRGYCMSYSIPNTMDLGPSAKIEVEPIEEDALGLSSYHVSSAASKMKDFTGGLKSATFEENKKQVISPRGETVRILPDGSTISGSKSYPPTPMGWTSHPMMQTAGDQTKFNNLDGATTMMMQPLIGRQSPHGLGVGGGQSGLVAAPTTLLGMSGISGSEKRDVVSVSQCCNMMETEEVVVNLRCAANETRRLVFKSAKSCECFFCKHV